MIDTIEEFNYLVERLTNKNKEGKLGKSLQIKLQAFLEVKELINKQAQAEQLVKHDVMPRFSNEQIEQMAFKWSSERSNGDAEQDSECMYDYTQGIITMQKLLLNEP